MKYVSTRGEAPVLGFSDALLAGLARDGGLYLPESYPQFSAEDIRNLRGKSYVEIALAVLSPFVNGEIPAAEFEKMVRESYGSFRHDAVCPLVQTGANEYVLELFHGPTLAFKDVAMQLLSRMMDYTLAQRGQRATIVGATSGDTGGAAIEAFAGRDNTDIFILFPHGRVSPVQQRQMTSSAASNVHALSIDGNFDDCQNLVKGMFNDLNFRDTLSLSGVNSINWARIMPQIVYYFTSAISLGAPDRKVSFTVPTGNFGDIFAGFVAKQMGLPIDRLIIATNDNDILSRTIATGSYAMRGVEQTSSPSMDIQISSNFERLLFESYGRDAAAVRGLMRSLGQSGEFTIADAPLKTIREQFAAGRSTVAETAATIDSVLKQDGYLLDPHSAIGVKVARENADTASPMVVLATAHPAKFPEAVKDACGVSPALPAWLSDLMERKEHFTHLQNDLKVVEDHIRSHSRAAK
ncbi:threonine synthase [Pseudochrobactrum asaccharolyticum]|uniref:Threonine synthase n=1 Tax=Pseudochrobactrum asaccharolyticum TaxID=354351 RepID=A0A366E8K1_9HYPH|nr:threonine synthase [Pseudochrobactrum asaccharolyticum]RBO98637.1 L-threonine synthase [Pseudochrobactrum asaccharolyticum]